ncbi:hypothetical protein DX116_11570 [Aeromicrobium endophyticum]|uniref:Uncharacterized protein n=1 Tax=Aeromicrobium endophyticum TaxID=2292704 RepID=A0A371P2J9_9ACTN|nr:hypothetical protein DX116_11570 [Aeromicrobium endophyticum]
MVEGVHMLVERTLAAPDHRVFVEGRRSDVIHATAAQGQALGAIGGRRAAGGTLGGVPSAASRPGSDAPTADISGSAVGRTRGPR